MKTAYGLCVLGILLAGLLVGCDSETTSPRFIAEEPFALGSDVTAQTALRLEGINGKIVAQVSLLSGSEVRLGTGNGDIRLEVPTQTSAVVSVAAGNGEVAVYGLVLTNLVATGKSSLSGRLGSGDGQIVLSAGNGDIDLVGR